jgi:2-oxoglutarate ferredoxin oxidoreductase subunit gamma
MSAGTVGIRLAGFGGQGVVMAGLLLGHAAVHQGLYAAGSNSYGAQSRGSVCKAEVVIGREPIDYPHVEFAGLFVAMSQEGYDAYVDQVMEGGNVFFDTGLVSRLRGNRNERGFDVTTTCVKELEDKQAVNVIWTGIVAGATDWFSEQSLEQAIQAHIPPRFVDLNLRALRLGLLLARERKER